MKKLKRLGRNVLGLGIPLGLNLCNIFFKLKGFTFSFFTNLVNLNRSLGGGWSLDDPDPDLPVEEDTVAANDGGDEEEEVDQ